MKRERLRELKSRAELGEATKRTGRKSSLKELILVKPSVASGLGQKLERALPIGVDMQTVRIHLIPSMYAACGWLITELLNIG